MPLPEGFVSRLHQIVPPERLAGVLASFAAPQAVAFRVNPLRGSRADVLAALAADGLAPRPVAWYADAFTLPAAQRAALLASAPYAAGQVYPQNLSSMVPPLALAPQPGERILDLAAAPGSKTLQMAAAMGNTGEIVAMEIVRDRYHRLGANLRAGGAANVFTLHQDGTRAGHYRPDHFDRVLLDAPCSTEGRFRADDPETYRYWSPRKIREMQRKQRRLLQSGLEALRPGGVLVYSTCSLAPEENEVVLADALDRWAGRVVLEPLPAEVPGMVPPLAAWEGRPFDAALAPARRILPDGVHEAFFVARLAKKA